MSATFDPGAGWREVSAAVYAEHRFEKLRRDRSGGDNGLSEYWIWEEPVPPLPTEPYTVIRAKIRGDEMPGDFSVLLVLGERYWTGEGWLIDAAELQVMITGFEVLAVPAINAVTDAKYEAELVERVRRDTAKAVLDRVLSLAADEGGVSNLHLIAREFGVTS